jgi:hypothetical protein
MNKKISLARNLSIGADLQRRFMKDATRPITIASFITLFCYESCASIRSIILKHIERGTVPAYKKKKINSPIQIYDK